MTPFLLVLIQGKISGADPVAIAQAAGFEVTTEDHQRAMSDEELEAVSGGKGKASPVVPHDMGSKDIHGLTDVGPWCVD